MITTSNSSFYEEERNAPDQLRILTIRLLFADPPGANVGRVPNPQLKLRIAQMSDFASGSSFVLIFNNNGYSRSRKVD
jgi:hypothetical protein